MAASLMILSCDKVEKDGVSAGVEVKFSAISVGYGPASRTTFSLDADGESGVERIDWFLDNGSPDGFTVYSPQAARADGNHYASYSIESYYGAGSLSVGTTSCSNPLLWPEEECTFYALYPLKSMYDTDSRLAMEENVVTIGIPDTPGFLGDGREYCTRMSLAYMYAVAKASPEPTAFVPLEFKPLMTAFRFSLLNPGNATATKNLKKVVLRSAQTDAFLTGEMTVTLNEDGTYTAGEVKDGGNEITISASVTLSATQPYAFTFIGLPMDQTDPSLELTFANDLVRTMPLTIGGTPVTVLAGHKAFFDNISVAD